MTQNYYYYQIDKKGTPIAGSNIKTIKPIAKKNYINFLPQSYFCCTQVNKPLPYRYGTNVFIANRKQYYVRTDENNNPVSRTLMYVKNGAKLIQGYQQVFAISCCFDENISSIEVMSITFLEGSPTEITILDPSHNIKNLEVVNLTTGETLTITITDAYVTNPDQLVFTVPEISYSSGQVLQITPYNDSIRGETLVTDGVTNSA